MIDEPFNIFTPFKDSFDLRFFTKEANLKSDADLGQKLDSNRIASLWQVHGGKTIVVHDQTSRSMQADAMVTDTQDLWLSIRAADCQQIIVYAPEKNVCGVAHAGWKGLKAGIIPSMFDMLNTQWGIDPSDTYVAAGPSLCTTCAEFTDPHTELAGLPERFFSGRNADLRAIADWQLAELGLPKNHLERHPDCTRCMPHTYWSYRGGDHDAVKQGYVNVIACRLK